jgi:hypothetical protein
MEDNRSNITSDSKITYSLADIRSLGIEIISDLSISDCPESLRYYLFLNKLKEGFH